MYSMDLIVRRTGSAEWTIYSASGVELHSMHRCHDASEAKEQATAWASSWNSVNIKVEDERPAPKDSA